MAEFPWLVSVVRLPAGRPGEVRVLLTCSCGRAADFTFEAGHAGEAGRSYTCGCRAAHWFEVPAAGGPP